MQPSLDRCREPSRSKGRRDASRRTAVGAAGATLAPDAAATACVLRRSGRSSPCVQARSRSIAFCASVGAERLADRRELRDLLGARRLARLRGRGRRSPSRSRPSRSASASKSSLSSSGAFVGKGLVEVGGVARARCRPSRASSRPRLRTPGSLRRDRLHSPLSPPLLSTVSVVRRSRSRPSSSTCPVDVDRPSVHRSSSPRSASLAPRRSSRRIRHRRAPARARRLQCRSASSRPSFVQSHGAIVGLSARILSRRSRSTT